MLTREPMLQKGVCSLKMTFPTDHPCECIISKMTIKEGFPHEDICLEMGEDTYLLGDQGSVA